MFQVRYLHLQLLEGLCGELKKVAIKNIIITSLKKQSFMQFMKMFRVLIDEYHTRAELQQMID